MGKTAGRPRSFIGPDRFMHAWRAQYDSLAEERDKLNEKYPVGTLVRYWYESDRDWNSTFGYISRPFHVDRSIENWEVQSISGYVLPIGIHKKYINAGRTEGWEQSFEIYGTFASIEKTTMEEYCEYARRNLIKGIRQDRENLRSIKRSIKDYRHKQKTLKEEMEKQAMRAAEEIKKMAQKTFSNSRV